ncbi:MAG: hypothetical protein ACLP19_07140 [Xanthobacteraceae bacterium]
MAYSVTFKQNNNVLFRHEFEMEKGDNFSEKIEEAHDAFRKAFPKVSLFDGITVVYDKD